MWPPWVGALQPGTSPAQGGHAGPPLQKGAVTRSTEPYRPTTRIVNVFGRIVGRGRGCSAVGAGAGPNWAVVR